MTVINIHYRKWTAYSLKYVSKLFYNFLIEHYSYKVKITNEYDENAHNILIDETLSSLMGNVKSDVYWTDTPINFVKLQTYYLKKIRCNYEVNYATSISNFQLFRKLCIKVNDVIPRLINSELFNHCKDYGDKDYDLILIANEDRCARKRVKTCYEVAKRLKLRSIFVTNEFLPSVNEIKVIRYGILSDEEKAELLSRSKYLIWLSNYEGFGMPVLEAMACGTPVIYADRPAYNEFAVGIKIPVEKTYKTACYNTWIEAYYTPLRTILEHVETAINLTKDEYQELQDRAISKAIEIYNQFVDKVELLLP